MRFQRKLTPWLTKKDYKQPLAFLEEDKLREREIEGSLIFKDPYSLHSLIPCIHVFSRSKLLDRDWMAHDIRSYFKSDFILEIVSRPISIQWFQLLTA